MKSTNCDNGVTVAREEVAKFIRQNPSAKWKVFKNENNLKGFKKDILDIFEEQRKYQRKIHSLKEKFLGRPGVDSTSRNEHKYRNMLAAKKINTLHNIATAEKYPQNAISLQKALTSTFSTSYPNSPQKIQFGDDILRINWDEENDWDYYSKSYGKPKTTYSGRRVEKLELQKDCNGLLQIRATKTAYVNSFQGQFLPGAIAELYGSGKCKVAKDLKKLQLNDYFAVTKLHKIGDMEMYKRSLAGVQVDFCAVYRKTTYHAETVLAAMSGLRRKLADNQLVENEKLTVNSVRKFGFCLSGILQFCDDNGIDRNSELTRQELRNIVVQNRTINCSKYKQELRQIGITLNCK